MARIAHCAQSTRHRVDHGTICGRSCANSGHYKLLCACVDRIFVNPKFPEEPFNAGPIFSGRRLRRNSPDPENARSLLSQTLRNIDAEPLGSIRQQFGTQMSRLACFPKGPIILGVSRGPLPAIPACSPETTADAS
jgi:hypothetical protein